MDMCEVDLFAVEKKEDIYTWASTLCDLLTHEPNISKWIYRFPSLFAVDTFRHFGPRILNSQIKSPFLTEKLLFWTIFPMWISEFADKKSANNEGCLYTLLSLSLSVFVCKVFVKNLNSLWGIAFPLFFLLIQNRVCAILKFPSHNWIVRVKPMPRIITKKCTLKEQKTYSFVTFVTLLYHFINK